ncbi:MAG: hypothetical protein ACO1RX_19445 [Candidatus Sericytochromatia bacterium]
MKISTKTLLSSSLSLLLVGCNMATSPTQTPMNAANTDVVKPAIAPKSGVTLEKPSVTYTAQGSVKNQQENIQVDLNWLQPSGFSVQFAPYSDLKFIQVKVMGKNLAGQESTWTTTQEYVPVTGRSASASVVGIPVVDGALRIVEVTGFDADKNPLPAFNTQSYYLSETDQTVINLDVDRGSAVIAQVLKNLENATVEDGDVLVADPRLLTLLEIDEVVTAIKAAMNYDPLTQSYEREPMSFDAEAISDYITTNMTLDGVFISVMATLDFELFLTDGSAQIAMGELDEGDAVSLTFAQLRGPDETRILGENLILMINDPTSKPVQIPVGTESGVAIEIPQIAPGQWTLTLANEQGTVLRTATITVDEQGTSSSTGLNFTLSGEVKELREVSIQLSMLDKMAKWGEPLYLNFSSRPGYKVKVDGESRYTHGAMVPVGESTVYVRSASGRLFGQTQITVAPNGTIVQTQNPIALSGVSSSEAFFVNENPAGLNTGARIAHSGNGDYAVAWVQTVSPDIDDNLEGGLMARIYAADGTPKTPSFQVVSLEEIGGGDSFEEFVFAAKNFFDVGMDQSGNFVVSWTQYENGFDGDNNNVYAQIYNNSGVSQFSVPFRVHTEVDENQSQPAVAVAANGKFVVTWSDTYDHNDEIPLSEQIDSRIRGRLLDINRQNVSPDEFYISGISAEWNDGDAVQVSSRVAMNQSGDLVVSWIEYGDGGLDDGEAMLRARVFNANSDPAADTLEITDLDLSGGFFGFFGGGGPFDGDSLPFQNHDVSMGTNARNFVVSWANSGEEEVEGQSMTYDLNDPRDLIYARHYYPQSENESPLNFRQSDTMAVSYNPLNDQNFDFADGDSYAIGTTPSVDMNAIGDFVVSWTELSIPNENLNGQTPEEFDYALDFDFQTRNMSNISLRSRVFSRLDNDLFSPARTNFINPNAFKPFPFGNFYDDPGIELYYFLLFGMPSADIVLANNQKPIATWNYFDIFKAFESEGLFSSSDISGRSYASEILAPVPTPMPTSPPN